MRVVLYGVIAVFAASSLAANAQSFPRKPIRVVTVFGAGAGGDVLSRIVLNQMSEILGQPLVVDNRPGAGGVLGGDIVAHAAPDGYTLLVATTGTHVLRPATGRNTPFDAVRDFTPITAIGETPSVIFAHADVPARSFRELIEYARANPGKLSYATSGIGSQSHLAGEEIQQLSGANIVHVPYKVANQGLMDVVAGQLSLSFNVATQGLPHVRTGKLKALAVLGKRANFLPEVAAVAEVLPGFEPPPSWQGIFGPAKLPLPMVRRLNEAAFKSMNMADTVAKIHDTGTEITCSSPEDFAALIQRQIDLVAKIVKASNLQLTD